MSTLNQNLELRVNNNMISDALSAVAHDARTQIIAFSGLWLLLSEGRLNRTRAIKAAAKEIGTEVTTSFQNESLQIFRELRSHQAAPGIALMEAGTADLHPDLRPYMDLLRAALLETLPETATATRSPVQARREYDGGMKLVKSRLNQQSFKDCPDAYRAIDSLNQVAYKLNPDMSHLTNLPTADGEYSKRYDARQMDILSTDWLHGKFYFKHTLDSRGRVYARSVLLTPQGDSFAKAFLDFAEAKPLGQYGLGALAVHFANCSGHDKLSFVDRIAWAKSAGLAKARQFDAADHDWSLIAPHIEDSKHAFEEYIAGIEFLRAINSADPAEFLSSIITHQDATTSGFQFGAALLGDRATAALTNITGDCSKSDKPADLYGEMAKHLAHLLKQPSCDPELNAYLEVVDRKFCKKPIMTTGYGAGINTIMKHIKLYLEELDRHDLAQPFRLALLKPLVSEALSLTASSMLKLSSTLRDAAKVLVEWGTETLSWKTPDGFVVYQQYRDNSHRKVWVGKKSGIRALLAGEIDPLDEAKMATALPPNFIHSMDGYLVRHVALQCQAESISLAAIHDSFGTHAGSFKELNRELKHAFAHVFDYNWFGALEETTGLDLSFSLGDYSADEALLGVYMFS